MLLTCSRLGFQWPLEARIWRLVWGYLVGILIFFSPPGAGGGKADGSAIVVLFVLWYCYKRGREERLEKERLAAEALAGGEGAASEAALTVVVQEEGEGEGEGRKEE